MDNVFLGSSAVEQVAVNHWVGGSNPSRGAIFLDLLIMIIDAKSKTFLVGEYCVTCGGSAIVLCTDPKFRLRIKSNKNTQLRGIKEGSPAFAFYMENRQFFKNLFIKFIDPYKKTGGFGASSAQFATLYKLRSNIIGENNDINVSKFLDEYRSIAGKGQNIKPSGADCLAQFQNNHIYFNSNANKIENLQWNFKDIDFLIFKTGNKVATHEHLRKLSPDFICANSDHLNQIVERVRKAWIQIDSENFVNNIMDFSASLNNLGLVCDKTQKLVSKILKIEGVLAAKGCGAMASDTIIIIFEKKMRNKVINAMRNIFSFDSHWLSKKIN